MAEATLEPAAEAPVAEAPAPETPAAEPAEEPAAVDAAPEPDPPEPGAPASQQKDDGEAPPAQASPKQAPTQAAPAPAPKYTAPLEVITDAEAMRAWSRAHRAAGRRVGLVPTMGYLHDGHLSLVNAALERADAIVVSIYVNPAQFAANEDFGTYPRDSEGDLAKLRALGVHAVFQPKALYRGGAPHGHDEGGASSMGGGEIEENKKIENQSSSSPPSEPPHETFVTVEETQKGFCSRTRPHFFRGVATVVCKLFNICEPDVAVFGKKDYQQWRLVRRMARDLDFAVDVAGVPLAREADGLAMSSRNVRLTPTHRAAAVRISEVILLVKEVCELALINGTPKESRHMKGMIKEAIQNSGGIVDYVDIVEQRSLVPVWKGGVIPNVPQVILVAAKYGDVRLLDNVELFGEAD